MTHICVSKLPITGLDSGLSPGRHQAIIWTDAEILPIGPLGTEFIEISIDIYIQENAFENVVWKIAVILAPWRLLGPVAYTSYHCVSLKNRPPLKLHLFHKNIVLHNIMCETNCTVIRAKFYR